jgi:hypothetical protein
MLEYSLQHNLTESLPPERQNSGKTSGLASPLINSSESEDEPVPCFDGDAYAAAEEVYEAVEAVYKKNNNFQIKLIKYAARKIVAIMGGKNDKRLMPDDVVEDAVFKILNLDRKWYKKKVEKIENLILMVIVSLIRIEAEKIMDIENQLYDERMGTATKIAGTKNQNKRRIIPLHLKNKDGKEIDNTVIDNEHYKQNIRNKYEDDFDYEQLDENELISILEKELEVDETSFFVLQEILDGKKSNIGIAADLGIEVKDVVNARKRIKRKVLAISDRQ